ncbi:hypothetical protein FH972_020965 [Carpinus fangiana]|uniref:GH16 domain-containing protein n=1 Tax=Carpinus fangiana TaxID=176857 RepID=A0A5N6KN67_9ROSI|nr:hypothetical protein FH972_020965 [Carpinus fangiana]
MSFSLSKLTGLAVLITPSLATYTLSDEYNSTNFFDKFNFWDTNVNADPTKGFVKYLPRDQAEQAGLISTTGTNAIMRVDNTSYPQDGRASVRVQSNTVYNQGLFLLDLDHMPHGCGTWPAFWMVGPDWPKHGELDIIENVHEASSDLVTLHTDNGCNLAKTGAFTGKPGNTNCAYQPGCGVDAANPNSYGINFNNNGGGVYATEWNSDALSIWFFPRDAIPADISAGAPTLAGWGPPMAQFYKSGCNIDQYFADMQIVFNIDFCGEWAGEANVWGASCSQKAATCEQWVSGTPSAFTAAYWSVRTLKVYTETADVAAHNSTAANPKLAAPNALFVEKPASGPAAEVSSSDP